MKLPTPSFAKGLISALACVFLCMPSAQAYPIQPEMPMPPHGHNFQMAPALILGVVKLGVTTISEFLDEMDIRGCDLLEENKNSATVSGNCVNLPGDTVVHVFTTPRSNDAIEIVALSFSENPDSQIFNHFLAIFSMHFGEGTVSKQPILGADQEVSWTMGNIIVSLLKKREGKRMDGTLLFVDPEIFELLKEDSKEEWKRA